MASKALMIVLPDVSTSVTISADWFERRDFLVEQAAAVKGVATTAEANAAGEVIRLLAKQARELETQRTTITAPFLLAQRTIKSKADEASTPLAKEEKRLKTLLADYLQAEARRIEAERIAAEQKRQAEIEEQVNHQLQAAALFDEENAEPAPVVVVVQPAPELVRAATVAGVRMQETLCFTVTNADEVPRRFLVVNEAAIRAELKANEAAIMAKIKEGESYQPIPGVAVCIETRIGSR